MPFKFFGSLDPNHLPETNLIWAFTMGNLTAEGWDSEKQRNLQMLVQKVEAERKKQEPLLTLAIPRFGGKTVKFEFGDKGTEYDKLSLFMHASPPVNLVNPTTILVFHNLKVKEKKLHLVNHRSTLAAAHTMITLSVDQHIEVLGATA